MRMRIRRRREMGVGKVGDGCMKTEGVQKLTQMHLGMIPF